jgi:hypothetical protein
VGLRDLVTRWRPSADEQAIERAEEQTRMIPYERDVDREDYEAKKDDAYIGRTFAGGEAEDAAREDLE